VHLPQGCKLDGFVHGKHLLKLRKNLYDLKDAGCTWYEHIRDRLLWCSFQQSEVDPCLFTKDKVLFILYVHDAIIISPDKSAIERVVKSLHQGFAITDEGPVKDYLGIPVERLPDGKVMLVQKCMIDGALQIVGIPTDDSPTHLHDTPANLSELVHYDKNGLPCKHDWSCRAIISVLIYLMGMTQPDLAYIVYQCSRFNNDPKLSHEKSIKQICPHLKAISDKGLILDQNLSKGFEYYVDAD